MVIPTNPLRSSVTEPLGLEHGAVRVVPYDSRWPVLYQREADRIDRAFMELTVKLVSHHTGSTAVPGLSAKPVIDILAGWSVPADRDVILTALVDSGYSYRGEQGIAGRDFFRRGDPRSYHLHLTMVGSEFWTDHLAFRDYLRGNPPSAAEYGALKTSLADRYPRDREAYIHGKTEFVNRVLRIARAAALTGHS